MMKIVNILSLLLFYSCQGPQINKKIKLNKISFIKSLSHLKKNKGSILFVPGLNLSPFKIKIFSDRFNELGFDFYTLKLSGMAGDIDRLTETDAEDWLSDLASAFEVLKSKKNLFLIIYTIYFCP